MTSNMLLPFGPTDIFRCFVLPWGFLIVFSRQEPAWISYVPRVPVNPFNTILKALDDVGPLACRWRNVFGANIESALLILSSQSTRVVSCAWMTMNAENWWEACNFNRLWIHYLLKIITGFTFHMSLSPVIYVWQLMSSHESLVGLVSCK